MNDDKRPLDTQEPDSKQQYQEKKREEKTLEKAVEDTFPASDPLATTQPGGGITVPEVIDETKIRR